MPSYICERCAKLFTRRQSGAYRLCRACATHAEPVIAPCKRCGKPVERLPCRVEGAVYCNMDCYLIAEAQRTRRLAQKDMGRSDK